MAGGCREVGYAWGPRVGPRDRVCVFLVFFCFLFFLFFFFLDKADASLYVAPCSGSGASLALGLSRI